MNTWTYRFLWVLLTAQLALAVWVLITYQPPAPICIQGMVMIPHKNKQMYVHQGVWPTHCVNIDTD